eukprot:TRINITY_DN11144_c0_g2_i1.p1 TRINITY_DN11144_c0_g2~~TRINITY_DN11144_c0_g2_i1.p1  ORF type:complete len:1006 (+),score=180.70 TRINITY_DN11144_c0_g2_i1:60-3020(+)
MKLASLALALASALRWSDAASLNRRSHFLADRDVFLRKPPRGFQFGDNGTNAHNVAVGKTRACGVSEKVNSRSDKYELCPASCPVVAELHNDGIHCNFACVEANTQTCKSYNRFATIVDRERGICRSCLVDGCQDCKHDGTEKCALCNAGYRLREDGTCENQTLFVWIIIGVVLLFIVCAVVAWAISLAIAPVTNEETLKDSLALRSRSKLRKSKVLDDSEGVLSPRVKDREFWPITTNLAATDVGGRGLVLFFNFHRAIIFWALTIGMAWYVCSLVIDSDLAILGLRRASTPRQNCIVVAWGYETQQALMYVKVGFCFGAYVFSFVGAILLGICQLRRYRNLDTSPSHGDFAARISRLPVMSGKDNVEDEIKTCVQEVTGEAVIGVSVCWDFGNEADFVDNALDAHISEREGTEPQYMAEERKAPSGLNVLRRVLHKVETIFLQPSTQKIIRRGNKMHLPPKAQSEGDGKEVVDCSDVLSLQDKVSELKTSDMAFVIFHTELSRNRAVEKAKELKFRDQQVLLERTNYQPSSVNWRNCDSADVTTKVKRVLKGLGVIAFALFIWATVFYLPYAYFAMSFNYAHGQEPGLLVSTAFSMIVVCGNATMYVVCSLVADNVGFVSADRREVCYMLLYSVACIFNVLLDLVCSYFVAYEMMKGIDMKTYHGTPLKDLDSFTDRFESYAMQRELGTSLMEYSFPSTFLIPFLIEPIAAIYLPWKLMTMLVRSHEEIRGHQAESYLGATPMDLSRYADLLLNVMLAAGIFFFPGGFVVKVFIGLAASHLYIYAFDHYKVLYCIPACVFPGNHVDWWAQWMLSIPCATLAMCTVFKANCQESAWGDSCMDGAWLWGKCLGVFFLHILLHTLALQFVVPCFGGSIKEASTEVYESVARREPCSWFNANPINVLRSQYFYMHDIPCDYFVSGKEHLLRANKALGCYFRAEKSSAEDYDAPLVDLNQMKRIASDYTKRLSSAGSLGGNEAENRALS